MINLARTIITDNDVMLEALMHCIKTKQIKALANIASENMPKLQYHNYNHVLDVYAATQLYGALEQVSEKDLHMLGTAAMLHDIIYVIGNKDNEEKSVEFSQEYLPIIGGYEKEDIKTVSKLIIATKMPTNPKNHLEEIMCDSDVDNLGRDDFFAKGEALRLELGFKDDQDWYRMQIKFLESHKYYTKSAKEIRDQGKERHIRKLNEMIQYATHQT